MSEQPAREPTSEHPTWTDLTWRERTSLLLGVRDPDSPAVARAALSQARQLRQRSMVLAAVGGIGGTTVWLALSLMLDATNGDGSVQQILLAAVFGLVFFVTSLMVARVQAGRLQHLALSVLEDNGQATRAP